MNIQREVPTNQQYLYYVFIDFKKAFDSVWNEVLWVTYDSILQVNKNRRPKVELCSMAVLDTGSEILSRFVKYAYSPAHCV